MEAGRLNKRIEIQQMAETRDSATAAIMASWTTVATRWARIEPLSGTERFRAQQAGADVTHRVTMRHYSGLNPSYRLKYGSRILEINAVINTYEANRETVCLCTEKLDE